MTAGAALSVAGGCDRRRTLNLYNWGDYIAPQVVRQFEAEVAGTRIVSDYYLSEAELVAKLRAGGRYDVVVPIDYLLSSMQRDGLLAPIDDALPGLEHLDRELPAWRARPDRGGRLHAIPYLWGTTGIGYDAERVEPPDSWNALFDPRYEGRISVLDSKGDVMDQALLAAGLDINSTDKAKIRAEIWPRLFAQKEILRAYDSDPARALVAGETWIAQIDSGDLLRAQRSKPSLRYVIPTEGAALWTDYVAIGGHASAPDLARRFIELLLRPEIAALNANELRFGTPNATALARGLVDDADDPQVYPPPDVRARLFQSINWAGSTGALVDELWLALRAG
jgi:spermidine/putrescine transport system substrate-binding protein